LGFRAQSEIGDDYIAASFQETEGECKRDAAAATSDQSGLSIEISEKHDVVGMKCDFLWVKQAEITGEEDEANLCRGLTFNTAVWNCPFCLMARLGWKFYLSEDGATSDRTVSTGGSSRGLSKKAGADRKG
jgi:hypothetical protein